MNTKAKGEISEGHVIAHLLKLGYSVSMPFGDNQRYDLIWDDRTRLWRVQVKTARMVNGCVAFSAASTNGFTHVKTGYRGQIELFMAYCPQLDRVYRVPVDEVGNTEVRLRVDPPRGVVISTIRWAKDYELTV